MKKINYTHVEEKLKKLKDSKTPGADDDWDRSSQMMGLVQQRLRAELQWSITHLTKEHLSKRLSKDLKKKVIKIIV